MIETYPAPPEPDDYATVVALADANPMAPELKRQIGDWIEPATMNYEADHADVMRCIAIAYPLIRARVLAVAERERVVRDDPEQATQIRAGFDEADRGETVYLGSFAQYLESDDA